MFIKTVLKDLYIKIQSISVFLDMIKDVDFQWKNADVSQGVCHVIYINFLIVL